MFGIGIWELVLIGVVFAVPLLVGAVALVVVALGQRSLRAKANLTTCRRCGHYVSRQADACPQCGGPLR